MELDRVEYLKILTRSNSKYRKKIQYVKLVPKDSDSSFKYIHLVLKPFNQIYKIVETGKNETVTTLQ